tara:strand:- start:137 stop:508 length:372 start_codon:yes stop_codon:yes gene_type:complete
MEITDHQDVTVYRVLNENEYLDLVDNLSTNQQKKAYTIIFDSINEETKIINSFSFSKNGVLEIKSETILDSNEFVIKYIEYNADLEIKYYIIYDNYSNGETKFERKYDSNDILIGEEFFERDI